MFRHRITNNYGKQIINHTLSNVHRVKDLTLKNLLRKIRKFLVFFFFGFLREKIFSIRDRMEN